MYFHGSKFTSMETSMEYPFAHRELPSASTMAPQTLLMRYSYEIFRPYMKKNDSFLKRSVARKTVKQHTGTLQAKFVILSRTRPWCATCSVQGCIYSVQPKLAAQTTFYRNHRALHTERRRKRTHSNPPPLLGTPVPRQIASSSAVVVLVGCTCSNGF